MLYLYAYINLAVLGTLPFPMLSNFLSNVCIESMRYFTVYPSDQFDKIQVNIAVQLYSIYFCLLTRRSLIDQRAFSITLDYLSFYTK